MVCVIHFLNSLIHLQQSPAQEQSFLTPWHLVREYVISLAQGSATFKWARNTVLHSHVHTCRLHSGIATNRPRGILYCAQEEWVWNGFQDAYLSVVKCRARHWHFARLRVHATHPSQCTHRDFSGISQPAPMRPIGYLFKRRRNLSMGCENVSKVFVGDCIGTILFRLFLYYPVWNTHLTPK